MRKLGLKQHELIVFCLLLLVTIFTKQTVLERLFSLSLSEESAKYLLILRASLNVSIGYLSLVKHETWWIKQIWCLFYLVILLAILVNTLAEHFIGRKVFTLNFDILASPFFYLLACLLPRLMRKYI
jgi:hypothetical protein